MLTKTMKKSAATLAFGAMALGGSGVAQAASVSAPAASNHAASVKQVAADRALKAEIKAAQDKVTKPGQLVKVATISHYDLYATQLDSGTKTTTLAKEGTKPSVKPLSVCSVAVASGVYALGAAALAAAAASGGLEVAGVFLAPEVLSQMSAAAGSFSALESIASQFVCD